MSNTSDFDNFDQVNEHSGGYTFERFKSDYPKYLDSLNNQIKLLYNTYVLIHNMRFISLDKSPECLEVARKCGFGMLMRHALETISTSLTTENGVEVGARSVYDRLQMLKGQNIEGFDREKKAVLSALLDITNEIAHPHVIRKSLTYAQLKDFYDNSFKSVLDSHILYISNIMQSSRNNDFGVPKDVTKSRKHAYKYLLALQKNLDNFNPFNKLTSILIQGCLVRQLTECTANRWCYNYGIVPTDVSTFENQISLSKVLESLAYISKSGKRNAFGTSALTPHVVTNLYSLKDASNNLMHVEKFASDNIVQQGRNLSDLYEVVKSECSPHVMSNKLGESKIIGRSPVKRVREKSPLTATLLCGTLGWFGAHHFYAGNIFKGVMYLLFGGFIIGPALDLYRLCRGMFRNSNRVYLGKTRLSSVLALIFLIIHLIFIYSFVTKIQSGDFASRIKELSIFESVSVQKCDNGEIENLKLITVTDSASSSHLKNSKREFDESLCVDGNYSTCWQDGVEGNGEGESLTFTFGEKEQISAISILNGKHTNEKAYYENARAEKLTVKAGSKKYIIDLDDVMQRQTFSFTSPIEAEEITFIIDSAYPGEKWEDLCVSEIEFYK